MRGALQESIPLILSSDPTEVRGRVIGPFKLSSAASGQLTLDDKNGRSFQQEARQFGFFAAPGQSATSAATVGQWGLLYCSQDKQLAEGTVMPTFAKLASIYRLVLPRPIAKEVVGADVSQRAVSLKSRIAELVATKVEVIVFLVPQGNEYLYSQFKGLCTTAHGVVSQCIDTNKISEPKMIMPVLGNVLKQIMVRRQATCPRTFCYLVFRWHGISLVSPPRVCCVCRRSATEGCGALM